MIRTVYLYGAIGRKYGKVWRLSVKSANEAARLLSSQIPGLAEAMEARRFRVSVGSTPGVGIGLDEHTIAMGLPAGDIHIVPVAQGGKSSSGRGIGKIIIGSLLIAASFFVPVGGSLLASIGLSLALSGVSTLIAGNQKKKKEKKSYMDGGVQNAGQGSCVPLIIGRYLTTPLIISASITVVDSNGIV